MPKLRAMFSDDPVKWRILNIKKKKYKKKNTKRS